MADPRVVHRVRQHERQRSAALPESTRYFVARLIERAFVADSEFRRRETDRFVLLRNRVNRQILRALVGTVELGDECAVRRF